MGRITALYDAYLRKTPRQSRSRSVVEAILGAASEKLSRVGNEDDLTIQEVASRAGVGIGSLYDYFPDRKSLLSALAAKATEDNRIAFEALLLKTESMSLPDAVGSIVDFALETYVANTRIPRAVMKIAHAMGLMPILAESQNAFAAQLAESLRRRTDVGTTDIDLAAWTLTQSTMGVVATLVWQDTPRHELPRVRADMVRMFTKHLSS